MRCLLYPIRIICHRHNYLLQENTILDLGWIGDRAVYGWYQNITERHRNPHPPSLIHPWCLFDISPYSPIICYKRIICYKKYNFGFWVELEVREFMDGTEASVREYVEPFQVQFHPHHAPAIFSFPSELFVTRNTIFDFGPNWRSDSNIFFNKSPCSPTRYRYRRDVNNPPLGFATNKTPGSSAVWWCSGAIPRLSNPQFNPNQNWVFL